MPPKVKSVYEVCPGFDVEMEDMLADIVSFRRHKPVKILPIQKGIIAVVIKDFYQYGFDYSVWIMTKENYSKVKGYCKLSYLPAMGIVQLDRNNRRVADEPALDIVNSYMFPFYRGQGIMRNAYLAIIHYFGSVRSYATLSKDAWNLWQSLMDERSISVEDDGHRWRAVSLK